MSDALRRSTRRAFLEFLAGSPALLASARALGQSAHAPELYAPERILRAEDAINVFDFHEAAKDVLPPGHYAYMAMGTDSGGTLAANREGFDQFRLRMRRLVNAREIDTSVELFGRRYAMPILIAPCGYQRAFHPEGELPVARAARTRDVEMVLSTLTSLSLEEINRSCGRPVWFQLYVDATWDVTEALIKRAERAGCPVLAVTVDIPVSNREALARFRRDTNPECQTCHAPGAGIIPDKVMFEGLVRTPGDRSFLDWDYIDRLREATSMQLVLKGIVTGEDAALALRHGVDGVIVSNHGGRAEDSGRSTIESLPEVVAAIDRRIPVIVDGGFRRGTDVFKALALGADAVAIGRPYLWGLGSFGQAGVETVLDLLRNELEIVMRQAGTRTIAEIDGARVERHWDAR